MKLRWLLFDYADPELPLSFWKRQKAAWRRVPLQTLPSSMRREMRRGRIICIFGVVLPGSVYNSVLDLFSSGVGLFVPLLLFVPIVWIWGCLLYGLFSRPEHYYRIRLEGFDICVKCGYWLRGLGEDVSNCPECGAKREAMPKQATTDGQR